MVYVVTPLINWISTLIYILSGAWYTKPRYQVLLNPTVAARYEIVRIPSNIIPDKGATITIRHRSRRIAAAT